jgi:GTP pyrophosphokinase
MDDFFALVGVGKLVLDRRLMEKLFPERPLAERREPLLRKVVSRVTKKDRAAIQVKDVRGDRIHIARCCSPIKGEPIVGYITSGKGMTVHARRCHLVQKEILAAERMVEVSWGEGPEGRYQAALVIEAEDSPGVLAKLTSVIANLGGNISRAAVTTGQNARGHVKLTLSIRDIGHLETIIRKISSIKEVFTVKRV